MIKTKKIYVFVLLLTLTNFIPTLVFSQGDGKMKIRTLVIDPGHGGSDPGAVGKFSKEKDITLAVSLKFGELIERNYPNIKVIYTRKDDRFLELYKRADIANKNNADLFVCVHVNASTSSQPFGAETFVMGTDKSGANMQVAKLENSVILKEDNYLEKYEGYDPNDPETHIIFSLYQNANLSQSLLFAQSLQDKFTKSLKRFDRGVKQAGFLVLWRTTMPAVLVELGFISNPEEEKYLNSAEGQEELAIAMFEAFVNYKNKYEDNGITEDFKYNKNKKHVDKQDNTSKNNQSEQSKTYEAHKNQPNLANNDSSKGNNNDKQLNISTDKTSEENLTKNSDEIVFKIQIKTSSKKIELIPQNFKSYQNVDVYLHDGIYKYTVGNETDYDKIVALHKKVKADFPDSFIIAFKNGKRISLDVARKEIKNKNGVNK
jgi:N-acetylmuramoyl-L-alanine amidase